MRGKDARPRVGLHCPEPSRTKQSMTAECDINNILKKYQKTGMITHLNRYQGQYGDFTQGFDFHESLNRVQKAKEMFMTIPATIRTQFDNDPGKFLEFVSDAKNADKLVEMGLAVKKDSGKAPPKAETAPESSKPA